MMYSKTGNIDLSCNLESNPQALPKCCPQSAGTLISTQDAEALGRPTYYYYLDSWKREETNIVLMDNDGSWMERCASVNDTG